MDFLFHEFVCASKQFRSDKNNRSGAISDFFVLLLRKIDKDATSWMFYGEKRQDGSTVVRDRDFLQEDQQKLRSIHKARTPMLSTSILSSPRGPSEVFTTFAIVCAAKTNHGEDFVSCI